MNKALTWLIIFCAFTTQNIEAQQIIYKQSSIEFDIKNLGINVKGTLAPPKGSVVFDPNNLSSSHFEVEVEVATINTNIDKRDSHLRSEDYFDAKKYPVIHFVSESIVRTSNGYIAYGKLKIKDVEKKVGLPFTYASVGNDDLFNGSLVINRLDYQVGGKSMILSDEVRISIKVTVGK